MTLLPFLGVAIAGAVVATALRDYRRLGTLVGFGAVIVALVAACFVRPDTPLGIGGGALAGTDHLRLVLVFSLAGGLLVLAIARLATWQPSAPATLLGGAAGLGLALGLAGTPPGLLGAAAATIGASALALGSPVAPSRTRALARELRGATTSIVVGLVAAAIVPAAAASAGPGAPAEPAAVALVLLGMALVLAHRFGAIPLHARVSRLADAAPSGALPILAAWLPAAWALVILGWAPVALGPAAPGLGVERGLITALGLFTLVLGTTAALIQDEVEHVVAYTIVADAGIVLLGLAALDPGARDAARAWVLVFATTRTAAIGWTIAFRAAFGTGRLRDTSGWLRRAPGLGVALVAILVAVGRLARPAGLGCPAGDPAGRNRGPGVPDRLRRVARDGARHRPPAGRGRGPAIADRGGGARRAAPPPGPDDRGRRPTAGRHPQPARDGASERSPHAWATAPPRSDVMRDPRSSSTGSRSGRSW